MKKHFFKKSKTKIWFPEILRVLFSQIYTIFKILLAFFKVSFRKWVPKTLFAVWTFANEPSQGNSWDINFCWKRNQHHENFYIPCNFFDKISYHSKSYFQNNSSWKIASEWQMASRQRTRDWKVIELIIKCSGLQLH